MAYLKRFTYILLILGLLALSATSSSAINTQSDNYREVSAVANSAAKSSASNQTSLEKFYANQLNQTGIKLHPGSNFRADSKPTPISSRKCKSVVYRTLSSLPSSHREQLSDLTLFYTKDGRRGLGGSGKIVLRCLNVADSELAAVFVHEMGHLVDGNLLFGVSDEKSNYLDFGDAIPSDDPSLIFYRISWVSDTKQQNNSNALDFVSGYSMTDPFEDFAETYTYYRLHGSEFRKLAESNSALKRKYDFMKNYVFESEEFENTIKGNLNIWKRYYDVTVLPFSLNDFVS